MDRPMRDYRSKIQQAALAVSLATLAAGATARADYSSTVLSFHPAAYWRLNETTPVPITVPAQYFRLSQGTNYAGASR